MKMVKALLLGSAAGLVAITAGQAAELPVKARPVQYVKICSLYGAGFYYMPGTDMCLKIGGWVRAEYTYGSNGSLTNGPNHLNRNDRSTNDLAIRARGYVTADAREQTAYGTARAYIDVGVNANEVGAGAFTSNTNRAFLQWAGFTAGLAVSAYDAIPWAAVAYRAGYIFQDNSGDGGWWVWQYTAQLGNGMSATFGMEDRRSNQIVGQSSAVPTTIIAGSLTSSSATLGYGGWKVPDFVGNLRVDQAWGTAQVMGGVHEVNALYYGPTSTTDFKTNGHPGDEWGFVVGGALKLNLPMITHGDFIEGEVNYTEGATRYLYSGENLDPMIVTGGTQGYGVGSDCVFGGAAGTTGTSCNLTTAWSAIAAYEHYWTPQWKQSIVGGYFHESYNSQANAILCSLEGSGNGAFVGSSAVATPGCNNDWSYWTVSSRLQWDVTKSFYIGVEALYSHLDSASSWNGLVPSSVGLSAPSVCSLGVCTVANQNNWAFTLRAHKNFLP
jgi:Porin subfamily